eukprot:316900-Prorocentrum_minimum.AAC.2
MASGHPYGFGVFAGPLKHSLGCTQRQLNYISSIGNLGAYIGIFAGLSCDKFGPSLTAIIGSVIALVGYLLLWGVVATDALPNLREPWIVALLFALACQSSSWLDTAGVSANLKNFPGQRGRVVGLLKTGLGLCSSVIAQVRMALTVFT